MNFYRELTKELFLSLIDILKKGYMYHSGALTYHFMLAMAPLTIVLLNITSFLPLLDVDEIERLMGTALPEHTNRIIREIIEVQRRSKETSFIALMLSYFFSVGFIKYMGKAFSFVSEGVLGERREVFYWVFMPLFLLGVVVAISASFFMSIYIKLFLPDNFLFPVYLSYILPGTLILTILYRSFSKDPPGIRILFSTSFVVSCALFLIQFAFTWYVANVFKGSLVYGSLSTIIVFLLWSNLVFLSLLFGARLIYRLKRP